MATVPPNDGVGSLMTAPPCGETIVKTLVFSSITSPVWRLVFPVKVVMGPIVMLPWVEFEARQRLMLLTPSEASIVGSSTGQR